MACIKSLLARRNEEAIDCLEKSIHSGMSRKAWFQNDNNLDSLLGHPRFQAVMKLLE